jgi:hypothetical protein
MSLTWYGDVEEAKAFLGDAYVRYHNENGADVLVIQVGQQRAFVYKGDVITRQLDGSFEVSSETFLVLT